MDHGPAYCLLGGRGLFAITVCAHPPRRTARCVLVGTPGNRNRNRKPNQLELRRVARGRERACRATACRARAAPPIARPRTASQLVAPRCIDPPLPPAVPPGRPLLAPRPRALQLRERIDPRCSCHCRMHREKGGPLAAGNPAACFLRASALICAPPAARRGPTDVLTPTCLA